jgi:hypothetical protein
VSLAPKNKKAALPAPNCQLPSVDVKARLDEIAAAIRRGAPASRYQKEMDRLLGTEMEERDEMTEAAWEESYRNQGPIGE